MFTFADFRQNLREFEKTLCHVPRLIIDDCVKHELESLETKVQDHEKTYLNKETVWESEKVYCTEFTAQIKYLHKT